MIRILFDTCMGAHSSAATLIGRNLSRLARGAAMRARFQSKAFYSRARLETVLLCTGESGAHEV
jgi:hypothetical protein